MLGSDLLQTTEQNHAATDLMHVAGHHRYVPCLLYNAALKG